MQVILNWNSKLEYIFFRTQSFALVEYTGMHSIFNKKLNTIYYFVLDVRTENMEMKEKNV